MKKPRVYVETSVVSYLTVRPARDIVIAARQHSTREWWAVAAQRFELVISDLVLQEAAGGDPAAACARLDALASFVRLDATAAAQELTERLVETGALPERAAPDAAHIAVAAGERHRLSCDMELRAYCERDGEAADRDRVPARRLRVSRDLQPRRTDGGGRR